jgi:GNAT superfamily N-acetyltransferase
MFYNRNGKKILGGEIMKIEICLEEMGAKTYIFSSSFGEGVVKTVDSPGNFFRYIQEKIEEGDCNISTRWEPLLEAYHQIKNKKIKVEEKFAYLDCLYIDENKRNKGNGNKLLSEITNYIFDQNYEVIALKAFPFESDAKDIKKDTSNLIHYYERFGFTQTKSYMFKKQPS